MYEGWRIHIIIMHTAMMAYMLVYINGKLLLTTLVCVHLWYGYITLIVIQYRVHSLHSLCSLVVWLHNNDISNSAIHSNTE